MIFIFLLWLMLSYMVFGRCIISFLSKENIYYYCFYVWIRWTTAKWCNKYTAISNNLYACLKYHIHWVVSNIAVYFYTQTMKDTMGGLVLLQLYKNQWEIMITVEKNINASSVYTTTTLSAYCKDVHFKVVSIPNILKPWCMI